MVDDIVSELIEGAVGVIMCDACSCEDVVVVYMCVVFCACVVCWVVTAGVGVCEGVSVEIEDVVSVGERALGA